LRKPADGEGALHGRFAIGERASHRLASIGAKMHDARGNLSRH
jgi:hypothetical protein